jgi:hypothetical protein
MRVLSRARAPALPEHAAPEIAKLASEESWKANLLRPGGVVNWQGGELLLTSTELAFVPHALNF